MQSVEVQLSCQRYHTTNLSEGFEICSEYKASQSNKDWHRLLSYGKWSEENAFKVTKKERMWSFEP